MAARHRKGQLLHHHELAEHHAAIAAHHHLIARRKKKRPHDEDHEEFASVGRRSVGRADRSPRRSSGGRADRHPWSSAAEHGIDSSRTTQNVGRNPGGSAAGADVPPQHRPGEATHAGSEHYVDSHPHLLGSRHGHRLIGQRGHKDHPGHHFAEGGQVRRGKRLPQHGPERMRYTAADSNVAREAATYMEGGPVRETYSGHGSHVEEEARETGAERGGVVATHHHHVTDHHGRHIGEEVHHHFDDGHTEIHHRLAEGGSVEPHFPEHDSEPHSTGHKTEPFWDEEG